MTVQYPFVETLQYVGKIRCPMYDSIQLTEAERVILGEPEVQRLRRLKQTAFTHYVFPAATHTRFEHSLGTMHMAGVFLSTLMRNEKKLLNEIRMSPANAGVWSTLQQRQVEESLEAHADQPWLAQCLRFAALLHDLGHGPFSHSGERFMPTWRELTHALPELDFPPWLAAAIERKAVIKEKRGQSDTRVTHEYYSLVLIERLFRRTSGPFLGEEMGRDVCSLLDPSVAPSEGSPFRKTGLGSLFSEIISGEIDVDRMDYLRRDASHCGVVYGLFDAGRILDSAVYTPDPETGAFHLALRKSGQAAYEDYLRARLSMYQQVYFHKTGTAAEAMLALLQKQLSDFTLPLDPDEYIRFDDHSFYYELLSRISAVPDAKQLLENLLFNRRLWKLVYEESHPRNSAPHAPTLAPAVLSLLRKQGKKAELIQSSTNLSRFSPKGRNGDLPQNTLKLLGHDFAGGLRFEAIEDHSRLINNMDEDRILIRVFVEGTDPKDILDMRESLAHILCNQDSEGL